MSECNALARTLSSIEIPLTLPIISIWGSNTGVGKTLFSAGIAEACLRSRNAFLYLKPVQTGFPEDSDARTVSLVCKQSTKVEYGDHAARLLQSSETMPKSNNKSTSFDNAASSQSTIKTLFAWKTPVSPHLAVQKEGHPISDHHLISSILSSIHANTDTTSLQILETAGGVASPSPSGTLQCDLSRSLRIPALLVGDGRLGGISSTIAAYESLYSRGYDIPWVVLNESGELENWKVLEKHIDKEMTRLVMPFSVCKPPPLNTLEAAMGKEETSQSGGNIIPSIHNNDNNIDENLSFWLEENKSRFDELYMDIHQHHQERVAKLESAAQHAQQVFWWPFTQHGTLRPHNNTKPSTTTTTTTTTNNNTATTPTTTTTATTAPHITVIDARCGEDLALFNPSTQSIQLNYDGCASWWTQGMGAKGSTPIAKAVGHAAARYGHVIFPQAVHEPALRLAQKILRFDGNEWASRVFFSDDGSTAVEVALKMAFRKYIIDHEEPIVNTVDTTTTATTTNTTTATSTATATTMRVDSDVAKTHTNNGDDFDDSTHFDDNELEVLGVSDAYHGDTLGAMDAVAPSVYNGRRQTPWFQGRGLFLEPPTVGMVCGKWRILDNGLPAINIDQIDTDNKNTTSDTATTNTTTTHKNDDATIFDSIDHVFAENSQRRTQYLHFINNAIDAHENSDRQHTRTRTRRKKIGACIIEPLLQGAGGMRFVDPEFHRAMVESCKARRIPVICDEVFSGLWRLGAPSASLLLNISPDIACFAKLLTGGVVPLALTLASEDIFNSFVGNEKASALLHGHSYTAHPIGCSAAVHALDVYTNSTTNPNKVTCPCAQVGANTTSSSSNGNNSDNGKDYTCGRQPTSASKCTPSTQPASMLCGRQQIINLWNDEKVSKLSFLPQVERVVALGTVLAVELNTTAGTSAVSGATKGYASNIAGGVIELLRNRGIYARPLGNVVYLMVSPITPREKCDELIHALYDVLTHTR